MIKRIFLSLAIFSFLFTACNKEEAVPPIIEKAHHYENQLKKKQGFSFANADLQCVGDYDDLFDGEYGFQIQPVNPSCDYTPEPINLFYILIEEDALNNVTLNLIFYEDLHNAIIGGEVGYDPLFLSTPDANLPTWVFNPGETLTLNINPLQEYVVKFEITFTDYDCIYEKSAEFSIFRGFSLQVNPIDDTSSVGNPIFYGLCNGSANAISIIVP